MDPITATLLGFMGDALGIDIFGGVFGTTAAATGAEALGLTAADAITAGTAAAGAGLTAADVAAGAGAAADITGTAAATDAAAAGGGFFGGADITGTGTDIGAAFSGGAPVSDLTGAGITGDFTGGTLAPELAGGSFTATPADITGTTGTLSPQSGFGTQLGSPALTGTTDAASALGQQGASGFRGLTGTAADALSSNAPAAATAPATTAAPTGTIGNVVTAPGTQAATPAGSAAAQAAPSTIQLDPASMGDITQAGQPTAQQVADASGKIWGPLPGSGTADNPAMDVLRNYGSQPGGMNAALSTGDIPGFHPDLAPGIDSTSFPGNYSGVQFGYQTPEQIFNQNPAFFQSRGITDPENLIQQYNSGTDIFNEGTIGPQNFPTAPGPVENIPMSRADPFSIPGAPQGPTMAGGTDRDAILALERQGAVPPGADPASAGSAFPPLRVDESGALTNVYGNMGGQAGINAGAPLANPPSYFTPFGTPEQYNPALNLDVGAGGGPDMTPFTTPQEAAANAARFTGPDFAGPDNTFVPGIPGASTPPSDIVQGFGPGSIPGAGTTPNDIVQGFGPGGQLGGGPEVAGGPTYTGGLNTPLPTGGGYPTGLDQIAGGPEVAGGPTYTETGQIGGGPEVLGGQAFPGIESSPAPVNEPDLSYLDPRSGMTMQGSRAAAAANAQAEGMQGLTAGGVLPKGDLLGPGPPATDVFGGDTSGAYSGLVTPTESQAQMMNLPDLTGGGGATATADAGGGLDPGTTPTAAGGAGGENSPMPSIPNLSDPTLTSSVNQPGVPGTSGNVGGADPTMTHSRGFFDWLPKGVSPLTLAGPAVALGGLGYNLLKGSSVSPAEAALSQQAGQAAQQGTQLESYLAAGTLPPAMMAQNEVERQAALARTRGQYAGEGGMRSAENIDVAAVNEQIRANAQALATQLYQAGADQTKISQAIYQYLAQAQAARDQALSQSIGNFATALATSFRPVTPTAAAA